MKARGSAQTIPAQYKAAADRITLEAVELLRGLTLEQILLASALVLSDIYGFGQTRINRYGKALTDIMSGYYEENAPKTAEDYRRMNDTMRSELAVRGIFMEGEK